MERVKVPQREEWSGTPRAWSVKYLSRRVWATQPLYDLDDLIQEAWTVWNTCVQHYPNVSDPGHFMTLYMRSVHNLYCTLARRRMDRRERNGVEESIFLAAITIDSCMDEMERRLHISEAPELVKRIVGSFSKRRRVFRRLKSGARETTNEYLCRIAGHEGDLDVVSLIQNWWTGTVQKGPVCHAVG